MINKIGSKRAKWFAVLDLTSGYHQAPIDEKSKHLTAFRTATGLWEWNRLPMGLQGAGSYFQHNVQHVVLKDMIGKKKIVCHHICSKRAYDQQTCNSFE